MKLTTITSLVNNKLAGELLSYRELLPFLDLVIDDINAKLNTCYPSFSDLPNFTEAYDCFPDRFIRSVVVSGAAWYYYVVDEEGTPTAQQFQMDYNQALFIMLRDMLYNIPEEYQADSEQGTVKLSSSEEKLDAGLFINPMATLE